MHGSPDQPNLKSLPDAPFPSAIKVEPNPTFRRPREDDPKPITKTRVRGPQYIGPQLSDSDDTSEDEADFEKFKMFTRIAKIVEFHHAAALADIDLALSICNGRKTKQLGKLEEEVQVTNHEKQILELQATKENERKAIVSAERKKRRDELRNRSIVRDPSETTDLAKYDALFDPNTFQIDVDVNGAFVLKREDASKKVTENRVNGLSSASSRMPAPEAPRVHNLSGRRDTLSVAPGMQSGWKSKAAPSALSQVHAVYDDETAATPIPQLTVDTTWSISQANMDVHVPGGFPSESKEKENPVTSAWGTKPSPANGSVSGSLSKTLGSTTRTREDKAPVITAKDINRISPPVEAERTASPTMSSSKKLNKKQRQANKKPSAAGSSSNVEPSSTMPTAPSWSRRPAATPHIDMSQARINGSAAEEEELSSTPRPSFVHMMMKKQGLAPVMTRDISTDDPASTPRHSALRQLGTTHNSNESTAEEESLWERMQKKKSDSYGAESSKQEVSVNRDVWQKPKVPDHRSADSSATTSSTAVVEESPWDRMTRLKAQGQAPQGRLSNTMLRPQTTGEEETPWQRVMRLKEPDHAPTSTAVLPSNTHEDETPWERAVRLRGQNQGANSSTKSMGAGVLPSNVHEESPWDRVVRLKGQNPTSLGTNLPTKFTTSEAENSRERTMNMASHQQSQHPNAHAFPIPPPIRQEQRIFWQPGVPAPSTTQSQMWNPGRTRSPHIEKSSSMAVPNGRSQETNRVRRMSDPVSPSPRLEFANLPDGDQQEFVPTSILKGAKSKQSSTKNKKVTIEEIPDDEGSPDVKLPPDSRYVLDIVEPKPSVPSNMYTRFFDFEGGEDDTELSSFAPTPSTAPTSPPNEIPSLDDDELMEEIKSGGWENLLAGSSSNLTQNAKHTRWTADSFESNSPSSQTFDSAKLLSALQSVNGGLSVEEKDDASPKPAPSLPSVPNIKDNKDTVIKPTKEAKGKAKGKGADKKGKSGGRK